MHVYMDRYYIHSYIYPPTLTHVGSCTNTGVFSARASECALYACKNSSFHSLGWPVYLALGSGPG